MVKKPDEIGVTAPEAQIEVLSNELLDDEGNVGKANAVKVTPAGEVYVLYSDTTNSALKYARYVGAGGNCSDGKWQCSFLQAFEGNVIGSSLALEIDMTGNPIAAYNYGDGVAFARYAGAGMGNGQCGYDPVTRNFLRDWNCEIVALLGDRSLQVSDLAVTQDNRPVITFYDDVTPRTLFVAELQGQGFVVEDQGDEVLDEDTPADEPLEEEVEPINDGDGETLPVDVVEDPADILDGNDEYDQGVIDPVDEPIQDPADEGCVGAECDTPTSDDEPCSGAGCEVQSVLVSPPCEGDECETPLEPSCVGAECGVELGDCIGAECDALNSYENEPCVGAECAATNQSESVVADNVSVPSLEAEAGYGGLMPCGDNPNWNCEIIARGATGDFVKYNGSLVLSLPINRPDVLSCAIYWHWRRNKLSGNRAFKSLGV